MALVCPEQCFSGFFNLGKTCFVSAILKSISTLTEVRMQIIEYFNECVTCKQELKSRKIITNGKYAKLLKFYENYEQFYCTFHKKYYYLNLLIFASM